VEDDSERQGLSRHQQHHGQKEGNKRDMRRTRKKECQDEKLSNSQKNVSPHIFIPQTPCRLLVPPHKGPGMPGSFGNCRRAQEEWRGVMQAESLQNLCHNSQRGRGDIDLVAYRKESRHLRIMAMALAMARMKITKMDVRRDDT
jgi:hypothetical protein